MTTRSNNANENGRDRDVNRIELRGNLNQYGFNIMDGVNGKYARGSMATSYWNGRSKITEWHSLMVFKKTLVNEIEVALANGQLGKGHRIAVVGSLSNNTVQDPGSGKNYKTTSVKVLELNFEPKAAETGVNDNDAEAKQSPAKAPKTTRRKSSKNKQAA